MGIGDEQKKSNIKKIKGLPQKIPVLGQEITWLHSFRDRLGALPLAHSFACFYIMKNCRSKRGFSNVDRLVSIIWQFWNVVLTTLTLQVNHVL